MRIMALINQPVVAVVHVTVKVPPEIFAAKVTARVSPISVVAVSVSVCVLPSVAAMILPALTFASFTTT